MGEDPMGLRELALAASRAQTRRVTPDNSMMHRVGSRFNKLHWKG